MPSQEYFKLYRDMIDTISYATYVGISDRIELAKELPESDRSILQQQYDKIMAERFNPDDCKSIIQIKMPIMGFPNEYRTFDRDGSERLCVFAHELHMSLPEYVLNIMHTNDFTIITNPIKTPRSAEEVLSKINKTVRSNISPSEMAETYQGSLYKEMETNINWNKVESSQIADLSESVREMQAQLKDLKDIIMKSLQNRNNIPERTQLPRPPPPTNTHADHPRIQDIRGLKKPKKENEEEKK